MIIQIIFHFFDLLLKGNVVELYIMLLITSTAKDFKLRFLLLLIYLVIFGELLLLFLLILHSFYRFK